MLVYGRKNSTKTRNKVDSLKISFKSRVAGFLRGFTDPFSVELNKFLDDFLLSRLGCNMLLGQYLACTSNSHITSIVNPQCDAFEICQKAAEEVTLGRG